MKVTGVIALTLLTSISAVAHGQQANPPPAAAKKPSQSVPLKKAKPPETGELAGFVFAITKAGDLKPARLAHIVLLYSHKTPDEKEWPKSAAWEYQTGQLQPLGDLNIKALEGQLSDHKPLSEQQLCLGTVQAYIIAVRTAVQWADTENKGEQVQPTDADEEGRFRLGGLPPGVYTLTASGQAGMNMAFWEQEEVVITAGQATSVKLATPKKACLTE